MVLDAVVISLNRSSIDCTFLVFIYEILIRIINATELPWLVGVVLIVQLWQVLVLRIRIETTLAALPIQEWRKCPVLRVIVVVVLAIDDVILVVQIRESLAIDGIELILATSDDIDSFIIRVSWVHAVSVHHISPLIVVLNYI